MKRLIFVFLAACGGSPKSTSAPAADPTPAPAAAPTPAPAAAADCAGAVNNTMAVSADQLKKAAPQLVPMMPKMAEVMIKHCNDDKWSTATVDCMVTGKTDAEQDKCQHMLAPDQEKKVTDDLTVLLTAGAPQ